MKQNNFMKIGELEQRAGVPKTTIRFYLQQGLLDPPVKTGKTMAYYNEGHLQRLVQIKKIQSEENLPLTFLKKRLEQGAESGSANRGPANHRYLSQPGPNAAHQKQERREQILRAASRVFAESGYHRTRIRDITRAADISTGTFYFYFKDKQNIYDEVVDDLIEILVEKRNEFVQGETDIKQRLVKKARALYENYKLYTEITFLVRAEVSNNDEDALKMASRLYRASTIPLEQDLEQAVEQGMIRKVDARMAAYALMGLIEIMPLFMLIEGEHDFNKVLNFLFDFVLRGLEPRDEKATE